MELIQPVCGIDSHNGGTGKIGAGFFSINETKWDTTSPKFSKNKTNNKSQGYIFKSQIYLKYGRNFYK